MGRIAKLISTKIEKFILQTVESYYGANVTAETYAPSGDDSPPLADDRIVLVKVDGTGNFVAVGVLSVSQGAKPGERILYSRNEDGEVQAALKLLNDGKIEMVSPADFEIKGKKIKIEAESDLNIKGQKVKIEGQVEATGGTFKCKGTAAPTGTGCLCALAVCPVSGAAHVGDTAANT